MPFWDTDYKKEMMKSKAQRKLPKKEQLRLNKKQLRLNKEQPNIGKRLMP